MAKIQNKTHQDHNQSKRGTSSSFLCCFGFSGKNFPEKNLENGMMMVKNISPSDHDHDYQIKKKKKKVMVRFSWPRLRLLKSSSGVKTVPVLDTAVPEKPQKDGKIYLSSSKPKSKSKPKLEKVPSKRQASATNSPLPNEIEIMVSAISDPTPKQKQKQKPLETKYSSAQNTNLENRKNSSPSHPSKNDTCIIQKRLSFSRKIESIRAGSSQPGSPVQAKTKTVRTIRHSDSFQAGPNRDKPQVAPTKPDPLRAESAFASRFEPVVGMSVVMVTLVIMVMWGRLCAILCTSAWLYFVPRLSAAVDSGGDVGRGRDLDLGSKECKKKVVFEGFLERNNHRINS